jgi:hypothetical protein
MVSSQSRSSPRIHCSLEAEKMSRLQDALPGDPQRAWQRRPNPLLLNLLRFAPESTSCQSTDANSGPMPPDNSLARHQPLDAVDVLNSLHRLALVCSIVLRSRESRRRSSSSGVGTRGSPRLNAISMRQQLSVDRVGFARRWRRGTAIEAASTTWLSIPFAARTRWIQNPSNPIS